MQEKPVGVEIAAAPDRASGSHAGWVLLGAVLLFALGLGARTHGDRDVSRYAQMAFEMRHDHTLIPTIKRRPYHEATPLAAWTTYAAANVVGSVTPATSRLFPALSAIGVIAVLYALVRAHGTSRRATIACAAAGLNYLAITYGRMSRIDPTLALGVAGAAAATFHAYEKRLWWWHIVAGVSLGLGIAAKGPLAVVLYGGAVGPWALLERAPQRILGAALATVISVAVTACWFAPYASYLGPHEAKAFYDQFLLRENLEKFETGYGKAAPIWTYCWQVFPAFAPWVVASIAGTVRMLGRWKESSSLERLALCWFASGFAVFSLASGKHIRYLLPLIPALAVLAAFEIDRWLEHGGARQVLGWLAAVGSALVALAAVGATIGHAVVAGPSASALVAGGIALAAALATLRALRRGDAAGALLGAYLECAAAAGFVYASVFPLPQLESRARYVVLEKTLAALVPANEPLAVVETRPGWNSSGIDETELGLHMDRWVDKAEDARSSPGYVLAPAAVGSRTCVGTVEWRPSSREAKETWVVLGPPSPGR